MVNFYPKNTRYTSCVVTSPPAMKLIVESRLGRSKLARPKTPWPLVQPLASRVPNPIRRPPANIHAIFPAGPKPMLRSNRPRSHVGCHPPPAMADRNPPRTNPATSGRRHPRAARRLGRAKYGWPRTRLHTSSKPLDRPSRRFATTSSNNVIAAMPAPAAAQWIGARSFRMRVIAGGQVTVMKAGSGFVIGSRRSVHGRARRFTQRQRTPSGTSVELAGRNWFQQGATHVYGHWSRRDYRYGIRLD